MENLNGDLHQPFRIRYESRSFSVRCLVSLAYWEMIDFSCLAVCFGTPQAIGIFLHNRIGDHTREVPSCFYLGVFGIQCAFISLIFLFLCQVWGNYYPVVSWRSKFCLSLSIYLIFLSFFFLYAGFSFTVAYTRGFSWKNRVCTQVY